MTNCPLCQKAGPFLQWKHLAWKEPRFAHCLDCDAVFVPKDLQADLTTERDRYAKHENAAADEGFLKFLKTTIDEIKKRIPSGSRILDFGSGPDPVLSRLLREQGFEVLSFDPFFNPIVIEGKFDLILAHEVFEHLREPRQEILRIRERLKPGGIFLIRSEPRPSEKDFANWWYARDLTHIFFASEKTLQKIAQDFNLQYEPWTKQLWAFVAPTSV